MQLYWGYTLRPMSINCRYGQCDKEPAKPSRGILPADCSLDESLLCSGGDPLDDAISPEAVWRRAIRLLRLRTTASHAT